MQVRKESRVYRHDLQRKKDYSAGPEELECSLLTCVMIS